MKNIYYTFLLFLLLPMACLEKEDIALEKDNFLRIYDNAGFSASFQPLDIKQTPDGGFIVLSSKRLANSNYSGVYIIKTDNAGLLVNELPAINAQYVNPVGELNQIDGSWYFFCMDNNTQQVQLVKLSANGDIESIKPIAGYTYPVASAIDGNNLLLLSYDNTDKEMVIAQINTSGATTAGPNTFSIGVADDTEKPIINHFLQGGRKYPFAIGRIPGGSIYYNGFYNYTFSLVFANLTAQTPPLGVVYGQQSNGGLSAIKALGGSKFASARFNFGDNYYLPGANITTNAITISTDMGGYSLPELVPNATIKLLSITSAQKSVITFASTTQSKQIALFFYNQADGKFIKSKYLGFSNPFEIGNLIQTDDGGLAVCGITYVAGRFPRICIFKLSKEEVDTLIN